MAELVDVFIAASMLPRRSSIEFRVASHSFSEHFSTNNEFGEARLEFEVPEWSGSTEAAVRLGKLYAPAAKIEPAKKWTIALIPHEHLDIGFTDYPAKVAELHSQSIDQAMELIKKTPRLPLDARWQLGRRTNI